MKDLFWLTVSKVSVHAWLAPLLLTCGEAEYHGGRKAWQSKGAHFMVARKQREQQEETRNKLYPLKTCLQ
jgi:hypothetical protein